MKYKGSRAELRQRLTSVAQNYRMNVPYEIDGPVYRELVNSINLTIESKLTNVINELVDSVYCEEDFENDIGLKS